MFTCDMAAARLCEAKRNRSFANTRVFANAASARLIVRILLANSEYERMRSCGSERCGPSNWMIFGQRNNPGTRAKDRNTACIVDVSGLLGTGLDVTTIVSNDATSWPTSVDIAQAGSREGHTRAGAFHSQLEFTAHVITTTSRIDRHNNAQEAA